jgi:UDP-N-acetylglucosamine--N-acetylmuramyl-(pentapeptide) pyrophosphoryl-undecaprenol N-acetylglucosamine transferase
MTEVLFVGADGKMEMSKVPSSGFKIIGLPIVGLQRKLTLKNLLVPFKVLASLWKARQVLKAYSPDIAVGVGGYASGPLLRMASWMGIPTLIQEQNSYPGITNKILAPKARAICVAYHGLEKYFPKEKIILTGNPIRPMVMHANLKRAEGKKHFDLKDNRRTVLIIGGSLGARTINESVAKSLQTWVNNGLQVVWQTGKSYYQQAKQVEHSHNHVKVFEFIAEMDLAYGASDFIISRAGAMSISELCVVGKPAILIPSPNVAEDHQTKNAMALVNSNAALLIADKDAASQLESSLLALTQDTKLCEALSSNCSKLAHTDAAQAISEAIFSIVRVGS